MPRPQAQGRPPNEAGSVADGAPTATTFVGDGVSLAADRWDPAPATARSGIVVLLHGGGQTRHSWAATARRLTRAGWSAVAIDSRGHGESSWAPDGDYRSGRLVTDLHMVVSALRERPVVVGASWGGLVGLLAAGRQPESFRGLVLVDVAPRTETEGTTEVLEFMRSGSEGFRTLDEAAETVRAYVPHRGRSPRPEGLRKNMRWRDGRWYWHWDPRMLPTEDGGDEGGRTDAGTDELADGARDAASRLRLPTLLVRGRESRVVSAAGVEEFLQLAPDADFVDVEDTGHMVAGDDNDAFAHQLVAFLERRVAPTDDRDRC